MAGVRVLADKGISVWMLDGKPEDPEAPTAEEINDGDHIDCVVGTDFNVGAGSPNTTNDGPLCRGMEQQVPTSATYDATISALRFYNRDTGQIDVESDFFFQAVKEFGSVIWIAVRDGGKDPRLEPDAEDGDEISIYEITSGGAGRASDRSGYQKRVIHAEVSDAYEDKWVGGEPPTAASGD